MMKYGVKISLTLNNENKDRYISMYCTKALKIVKWSKAYQQR